MKITSKIFNAISRRFNRAKSRFYALGKKSPLEKFCMGLEATMYYLMLMFVGTFTAAAAGNGLSGINEATSMVTSYFDPGTKLVYAIGAVAGLIGGIKVYGKFSSGDPDTSKTAASWFGACIFLIVAATILRSFFL